MNSASQQDKLVKLLADLEEESVLELVRQRVAADDDPLRLIEECNAGMRQVGERYEQGQYFLSGLIMAGEIFREARAQQDGRSFPIVIGGGMIDDQVCHYVGADHWVADAMSGVHLCRKLILVTK